MKSPSNVQIGDGVSILGQLNTAAGNSAKLKADRCATYHNQTLGGAPSIVGDDLGCANESNKCACVDINISWLRTRRHGISPRM